MSYSKNINDLVDGLQDKIKLLNIKYKIILFCHIK